MDFFISYILPFTLDIIVLPLFLIAGLILCYKQKYKGGFYFFILILMHQLFSAINPILTRQLMDRHIYLQTGVYPGHIPMLFSVLESVLMLLAVFVLIVSLYEKYSSRNITSELFVKMKNLAFKHKKIVAALVVVFLVLTSFSIYHAVSKDLQLVRAEVTITENPASAVAAKSNPGEEPEFPSHYLQYTFEIKNTTFRQFGNPSNFIRLDFVPSKEVFASYEDIFNDHRGNSGPAFIESKDTQTFVLLYGIKDPSNIDLIALEEQALNGQLAFIMRHKIVERIPLK